ncbi:MAG: hypothetical protein HUU01_18450 [Saprospiraceae bacterium]|nr:hypothetical protein [Saprospiraceae bacterium]
MHDIEPYHQWRDRYIASEDDRSPFHGRSYDEFYYTQKVYNYFIHPQWDDFGSQTLYLKVLFADYDDGYAIIELIGEWNDCLYNDIMYLKREVIDHMASAGISKFILICENVFNFHGSDDSYYEEWYEDLADEDGWICFVNTFRHVADEMQSTHLQYYVNFGESFNDLNWRPWKPKLFFKTIQKIINKETKMIGHGIGDWE